jgi:hypothetical protein
VFPGPFCAQPCARLGGTALNSGGQLCILQPIARPFLVLGTSARSAFRRTDTWSFEFGGLENLGGWRMEDGGWMRRTPLADNLTWTKAGKQLGSL